MIASLQLSSVNSSVISSPFVMSPEAVSPDFSPGSITPPYRGQSDYRYLNMEGWLPPPPLLLYSFPNIDFVSNLS